MRYQALTPEDWRDELIANATAAGRSDTTVAAHQSAQSVALRAHNTHLVTDDIERLTRRPAVTLSDFIAQHRDTFISKGSGAE
ncbi:hypothetical protein [Mycobacterium sp.]|uniref:hypothetical protein n=1 Tax=Mycobacterium sp. TaxID=1785 RepID=UPI002B90E232|nr:hypothetical protein [Mycobacterium sp.]HKP42786.1 hypothetical protein [Mycobacterium sp.]